jgi:hypothetical protein
VDGRIDRAKGNSAVASIPHTVYTIVWLNQHVRLTNPAAWIALPQSVYLKPADLVDPEANDYVDVPSAPTQQTSPGRPISGRSSSSTSSDR